MKTRTDARPPSGDISRRKIALVAGLALMVMAVLAPLALFGVFKALVVSGDAAATFENIAASQGLFRAGIAAFLIVILLDVVVAWALYELLVGVNRGVALLTAWFRVAFAAVFASSLTHLLDAAQLVAQAPGSLLSPDQLQAEVMNAVESFETGWVAIALGIFGLHLLGLGHLLARSADFSRLLGLLVAIAGVGYLVDSFGTILLADYDLSVGSFTFVGEALLIVWLLVRAIRGFPSGAAPVAAQV